MEEQFNNIISYLMGEEADGDLLTILTAKLTRLQALRGEQAIRDLDAYARWAAQHPASATHAEEIIIRDLNLAWNNTPHFTLKTRGWATFNPPRVKVVYVTSSIQDN